MDLWLKWREIESPLTRGRGLKLKHSSIFVIIYIVAPHAGAWIETNINRNLYDIR